MPFLRFGWDSIHSTEKIHRRVERLSIAILAAVTIFDFLEWKYWNAFWNSHQWLQLCSTIALSVLTLMEFVALRYGERKDRLQAVELKKREQKQQSIFDELRIASAESAMTAQIASGLEDRQIPRKLTQEHKAILKESLSTYVGQKFVLVFASGQLLDGEFAGDLGIVLLSCGWSAPNGNWGEIPIKPIPAAMRFEAGIRIDLSLGQAARPRESTIRAAISLFYALEKCGIPMLRRGVDPYPEICGVSAWGPEIIEVWIGPKE